MTSGFDEGVSARNAMVKFMRESSSVGRTWAEILPVAAVSVNESGCLFIRDAQPGTVLPVECFPTRQILALEVGNATRDAGAMPRSWSSDEQIMSFLQASNYISSPTARAISSRYCSDDVRSSRNEHIARIFAWLLDNHKWQALEAFAIGPTQVFLSQAPLCGGPILSFPSTPEQVWRFYTARTVSAQWAAYNWTYLPTNGTPREDIPVVGEKSSSLSTVEGWLTYYQTGSREWDQPVWNNYATRFKRAVTLAYSVGRELGLIT